MAPSHPGEQNTDPPAKFPVKERNQTKLHTWLGQEEKLWGPDSANRALCQQETQGWAPASQHGTLPNSLHCPSPAHRAGSWDHTHLQHDPQRGQTIDWGGPPSKSHPSLLRDRGGCDLHEVWGLGARSHWGKYASLCLGLLSKKWVNDPLQPSKWRCCKNKLPDSC